MGPIVKSRGIRVYGSLLRFYPESFQKQYSATMEQTFTDMLMAEQTSLGRTLVWARALADLPQSAIKEHITNGRSFTMNRNTKFLLEGALITVGVVGLASFWEGNLHSRANVGIERVTAVQLADAMQQDNFYSTYGDTVVLFSGKVASVKTQGNASLVIFNTGRPYNIVCQFPKAVSYTNGQTISLVAPAGSAERQPRGVLFHNCLAN